MKIFTACAVRADQVYGLDKRYVHFDTTSISVYGEYLRQRGSPTSRSRPSPLRLPMAIAKTNGRI